VANSLFPDTQRWCYSPLTSYSGKQTTVTDQAGKQRTTTTDGLGRLTAVVEDPNGLNYTTVYGYDALDDLTCVSQGGTAAGSACQPGIAHARSFYYDSLKRLVAANNPENASVQYPASLACSGSGVPSGTLWTTCYGYDARSNLLSKMDDRPVQTNYTYDVLNRLTMKTYSDGTTPSVAYCYDGQYYSVSQQICTATTPTPANSAGRLTETWNSVSATQVTGYNELGRITGSTQITSGYSYGFGYGYNFAGSVTSESLPSGRSIAITYDAANRPTTLQGTMGATVTNYIGNPSVLYAAGDFMNSIQYVPHGAVWAYTRKDGITRAEEYNSRLQSIESYYSVGNVNTPAAMLFVSCPHWGFGAVVEIFKVWQPGPSAPDNGNLVAYDEYIGGSNSYTEFSQPSTAGTTISYDGVNRLTGSSDTGGWSRSFGYDQWSNMYVTTPSASAVPPLNVNTPVSSSQYNANNQRIDSGQGYDHVGNVNAMNNFSNLTYDAENHLLTANSPMPFSYGYDGDGRRVTKSGAGNITTYVYDAAGQLAAEYNTSTQPTPPCTTCYLSYDHLGSVRLVTNGSGVVVSRHDFLPFGDEILNAAGRTQAFGFGGTDDITQKFTGKERDAESGLDYFGARYYGSALGRFTSPDEPFADQHPEDPQSWNLYGYVRNNPLKNTDPDGRDCTNGVSSCLNYIVGGLMAIGNIPSEALNAPNHIANALISPFTDYRFSDLVSPTLTPTNVDQQQGMNAANAVMMVSPVGELGAASEAATAADIPLITRNAAQGRAFQNAVAADTALTDTNVAQNVMVKTQSGVRTQIDVVSTNASGNVALTEAKSSATARLTPAQAAAHPEIAKTGATVVGKGKPGYPGGTSIPPTQVKVVRPCSGDSGCPK
jgi:RHS repeat-associated protein